MKNAFLEEQATRKALAEFIMTAPRLSMDAQCFEFERRFAQFQRSGDAILFNSGGSANLALLQALKNLGRLRDGDRVGFSALTWSTNVMPILQLGMMPVAVDVRPQMLNVTSGLLIERLKTTPMQAFFITNALGLTGDLNVIRDVCRERSIILIEDNCESLGTELPSGRTGNFGVGSTFSFYVAHHMSTIEGGMVCTNDGELAEMLRIVRANGWDRNLKPEQQARLRERGGIHSEFEAKYAFFDIGCNLRPTEVTGFLGLSQMKHLEKTIVRREENYKRAAAAIRQNRDLVALEDDHISILSSFAIPIVCRTPDLRREYVDRFMQAGIEVRPLIAGNMQRQPFYAKYVKDSYPLPGADLLHDSGFYCGNHAELSEAEVATICEAIG
jgi:CDP-6-deoxy-D-xylo-4-hexulose-3-dehydrase